MAWAIIADGVNDVMNLASEVSKSTTDEYTIVIRFKVDASPTGSVLPILYKDSGNYFYYRVSNTRFVWSFSGSTAQLTGVPLAAVSSGFVEVELSKAVSGSQTITFDGNSATFGGARAFSFNKFFDGFDRFEGQVESVVIYSDLTKTNVINNWDATASSHAAGTPVLTDTIGGNNATGVNMPTDGSAWIDLGGSGISIAVTEVLNSFVDTSNINIDYNVSATVTETLNSFGDTSVISVTSGQVVNLSVTETLSAFTDLSNVSVSANIDLIVTEVLNSFLDGSNVTIAKELTLQVTEVLNSFADNSSVRLPANWNDKPKVTTSYTTQTPVSTIWIDKG